MIQQVNQQTAPLNLQMTVARDDSDLVVTEEEIDTMVHDYYRLRGWDQNGQPGA